MPLLYSTIIIGKQRQDEVQVVETAAQVDLDKIVSLCKRRGFVFQSSEIYGGMASTWDYGPLGVELKKNVKNSWWRTFVW